MRRILHLAYYFPPIGGAGVQRNLRFARHLPELGFDLTVVTGPGSPDYRWAPLDDALEEQIPTGIDVHRLAGPEPQRSGGWRARAERWLGIGSPWERWWNTNAVRVGREVGENADLIYASLAPYGTAEAAGALARELRKPLVVDLEDPWALDEMMVYPSALHRRLELARMRRALAPADVVVMNTAEAATRVLERFPELASKLVVAIPNGFEPSDFEATPPGPNDGTFRIVHTGTLHTDLGRRHRQMALVRRLMGGATPNVDLLARSHVHLLEAVEAIVAERPELAAVIEVHLVGALTHADRAAVHSPLVRLHGFVPHEQAVRLMRSANLLFLPMHDLPEGKRVSIVPCKTYEYLASGQPILAAVPDGDARDLLAEAGNALLCRPGDVVGLREALVEQLRRFEAGEPTPAPDHRVVARFEPQAVARELASVLDRALVSRRARRTSRSERSVAA